MKTHKILLSFAQNLALIIMLFLPLELYAGTPVPQAKKLPRSSENLFYKRTFDLGASSGSVNNVNYTEIDLGLNLFFTPNLDFRNAIFARFASGAQNIFGLDSSMRGIYFTDFADFGITAFAGPGARIPSIGSITPFIEGGLILKAPGIGIGIGAKAINNSWVSNTPNETQIFIILAGGGEI